MSIYGCNNCYNPRQTEIPSQGILTKFYVQEITGRMYLIALCELCRNQLHAIEERDSINEGVNFIHKLIEKNTR